MLLNTSICGPCMIPCSSPGNVPIPLVQQRFFFQTPPPSGSNTPGPQVPTPFQRFLSQRIFFAFLLPTGSGSFFQAPACSPIIPFFFLRLLVGFFPFQQVFCIKQSFVGISPGHKLDPPEKAQTPTLFFFAFVCTFFCSLFYLQRG